MNKSVKSLFVAGAVLATALSCTKNESDPANPITCRLASIRFDSQNSESRQKFDQNGNVVRIEEYKNGALYFFSVLKYDKDKVVRYDSTAAADGEPAKAASVNTYILGANGLATSRSLVDFRSDMQDSSFFTYDANGYMSGLVHKYYKVGANGEKQLETTRTYAYTTVNGIRTQETVISTGRENDKTRIEYLYYDVPANVSYEVPNMVSPEMELAFLGKLNGALLKKATFIDIDTNKEADVYNYSYEYDEAGKPVKCNYTLRNFKLTSYFGYECK